MLIQGNQHRPLSLDDVVPHLIHLSPTLIGAQFVYQPHLVLDIVDWSADLVFRSGLLATQPHHQRLVDLHVFNMTCRGIPDANYVLDVTAGQFLPEVGGYMLNLVLRDPHQSLFLLSFFSVFVDFDAVGLADDRLELSEGHEVDGLIAIVLYLCLLSHYTNYTSPGRQ